MQWLDLPGGSVTVDVQHGQCWMEVEAGGGVALTAGEAIRLAAMLLNAADELSTIKGSSLIDHALLARLADRDRQVQGWTCRLLEALPSDDLRAAGTLATVWELVTNAAGRVP